MSWLSLSRVAEMLDSELVGVDAEFSQISIDTRGDCSDALFFALSGPNFDAHQVLDDEPQIPLAGLVVSRAVKHPAAAIYVADTRKALGQFAAAWRNEFEGLVVGLTGSNGKTTVKQMLASIFSQVGTTLATEGNLNNEIGVPLTLLNLRTEHQFAVVEMGANHAGEIAYLTGLVHPKIALITNAGAAHLEGFGSVAGVAAAKAEIFQGLDKEGVAVINLDDDYAQDWLDANAADHCITFGFTDGADVQILRAQPLQLSIRGNAFDVPFELIGRHNALNAAAAAAVALAANISEEKIVDGLSRVVPVDGRLSVKRGPSNSVVIDDTYNANPGSVGAAIIVLAERAGDRYLVLGDLAELGEAANDEHAVLGEKAKDAGIDGLFTLGDRSRFSSDSFGKNGHHFESVDSLVNELTPRLSSNATVLVKGSRAASMERVVEALESRVEVMA